MKITDITTISPAELCGSTTLNFPVTLANVYDQNAEAVSFYYSRASFSETSHEEEVLNAKHLINKVKPKSNSDKDTAGLSRDLGMIRKVEGELRATPARFKAIFACRRKHIWLEYDLPICEDMSCIEAGAYFQLVPLLRALESCTPYCVVIVENGKAKGFLVHGAEIHELDTRLPRADLSVHAEDSRVGWSHHIDSNVNERKKAYMRDLAVHLQGLFQGMHCEHLVVGCREEVWSEFEPELEKAGPAATIAGRFHLASFDLTAAAILQAARPVFDNGDTGVTWSFGERFKNSRLTLRLVLNPCCRPWTQAERKGFVSGTYPAQNYMPVQVATHGGARQRKSVPRAVRPISLRFLLRSFCSGRLYARVPRYSRRMPPAQPR